MWSHSCSHREPLSSVPLNKCRMEQLPSGPILCSLRLLSGTRSEAFPCNYRWAPSAIFWLKREGPMGWDSRWVPNVLLPSKSQDRANFTSLNWGFSRHLLAASLDPWLSPLPKSCDFHLGFMCVHHAQLVGWNTWPWLSQICIPMAWLLIRIGLGDGHVSWASPANVTLRNFAEKTGTQLSFLMDVREGHAALGTVGRHLETLGVEEPWQREWSYKQNKTELWWHHWVAESVLVKLQKDFSLHLCFLIIQFSLLLSHFESCFLCLQPNESSLI